MSDEHTHGNDDNKGLQILDSVYKRVLEGIPHVSEPVEDMVRDYIAKNPDAKSAASSMINYQIAKCTTSGFVTGFGGAVTLPVTIPANVGSVLYIQMRMIAACAMMGGYDLHSDQVQTMIYACLVGLKVSSIVKQCGIKLGVKIAQAGIKKIPGKILTKINQKIGFRFITKFGSKGLINLGKLIPIVGALISGGFDFASTRAVGKRAYHVFLEGDFDQGDEEIVLEDES